MHKISECPPHDLGPNIYCYHFILITCSFPGCSQGRQRYDGRGPFAEIRGQNHRARQTVAARSAGLCRRADIGRSQFERRAKAAGTASISIRTKYHFLGYRRQENPIHESIVHLQDSHTGKRRVAGCFLYVSMYVNDATMICA